MATIELNQQPNITVVVVPFPAQGHLNQLLHLSRLIAAYNIPVHVITTTTHNRQAQTRIPLPPTIHFHHYPTPHFPSPPPDPTANVKFPTQLIPSFATGMPVLDGELALVESQLPSNEDCYSMDGARFIASTDVSCQKFTSGTIFDASRVIEGKFIDLIEQEHYQGRQKLWALGPFNPVEITTDASHKRHKLFDWLEKQAPNSVLYVSFGTTTSISNEQIQELALGLEKSEQRFIWVLRDADKGDIFDGEVRKIELPNGFEERVGDRGLVVVDWVPQLEILGHPATGGFMSHCGWNSSMESMTMGVPVAAWPMHSDQPRNAMLITNVLKVGMYVRDWTQRKELVSSAVVEDAVRRLMASDEGEEIRKRAAELGGKVRESMVDGGVTRMELDSFVAHVTR
ncbi:putative trans-zeatin O-beta-D-glucosyltransferase [Helianthus annuus]|nr:putative trans-zeatin O-beta-D-glucosyltransferase [Helianthus annuus]